VLWPWRERPYVIARAAQTRPEGVQAPYRPVSRRLVLRTVVQAVTPAASEWAAEQHSAGPPTCGTGKPAPTAPKAGPRVGEAHDLSHVLPALTTHAVAVDEVHTIVAGHDADRAAGPVD